MRVREGLVSMPVAVAHGRSYAGGVGMLVMLVVFVLVIVLERQMMMHVLVPFGEMQP